MWLFVSSAKVRTRSSCNSTSSRTAPRHYQHSLSYRKVTQIVCPMIFTDESPGYPIIIVWHIKWHPLQQHHLYQQTEAPPQLALIQKCYARYAYT